MRDDEGVGFLQWALPRLRFRWRGFSRVRRQVLRRVRARVAELDLPNLEAYRRLLETHPEEWSRLDALCRVTVTRFYRDRAVWEHLRAVLLPELAAAARDRGESVLRVWSAGCASGEEPYTLTLVWRLGVQPREPELELQVVATDADEVLLDRARRAVYPIGCLRELPDDWRRDAFEKTPDGWRLRPEYREGVTFRLQDIRREAPDGSFSLVLCRNLAFTYFDEDLQRETLQRLRRALAPGGLLVVGRRDSLTRIADGWEVAARADLGIWRLRPLATAPHE